MGFLVQAILIQIMFEVFDRALKSSQVLHHIVHVTLDVLKSIVKLVEVNHWRRKVDSICLVHNVNLIRKWGCCFWIRGTWSGWVVVNLITGVVGITLSIILSLIHI